MAKTSSYFFALVLINCMVFWNCINAQSMFEGNGDIGNVNQKGSVEYNAEDNSYYISGSGANMWFDSDQFYFVWKKMSGDVSLATDIEWIRAEGDPHKKACLIIRQSLETNSVYADVAVHGDGLTSMQFRDSSEGLTKEVQANIKAPDRVSIEKEGDYLYMSVATANGPLISSGASLRLPFKEPFYIGLGVCSHNNEVLETAKFSNVVIENIEQKPDSLKQIESSLEVISIRSLDRKVVYHAQSHIEAPNWTPDGKTLIYNSQGLLYKIPIEGGKAELIPTGSLKRINNDHGISPDGSQMVISDQTETGQSLIYSIPIEGGEPKKITPISPSYWHGWSPDGKTLAYCAERNGNYDIYSIPFEGGEETRLTSADGLDDGPDYSPDGKYIYFNSERTGTMQVWRMNTDGSEQTQITTDEGNDWFPHPSPDGKWLVYVTFDSSVPSGDHPANKDVMLRLMNIETKEVLIMAKLFGGQGTINVPSWSPDSQYIAFVSYQLK